MRRQRTGRRCACCAVAPPAAPTAARPWCCCTAAGTRRRSGSRAGRRWPRATRCSRSISPASASRRRRRCPRAAASTPRRRCAAFVDPIEACLAAEVAAGRAPGLALVGHSLGGLVALELALRARLPVRRLVLIDAMGLGPGDDPRRARSSFACTRSACCAGWAAALRPPQSVAGDAARPPGRRARARAAGGADRGAGARGGGARVRCAVPARRAGVSPAGAPARDRACRSVCSGARATPRCRPRSRPRRAPSCARRTSLILAQGHSPHLDAPDEALPPLLDFLAAGARRG